MSAPLKTQIFGQKFCRGVDISGNNITRLYTTFKTQQATIDYACDIRGFVGATSQGGVYRVHFDKDCVVSPKSRVVNTSNPTDVDTLQGLIDTGRDYYVVNMFCQITGHIVPFGNGQAVSLVKSSTINVRDTKPAYVFEDITIGIGQGNAISELNPANDWSVYVAAYSESATGVQCIFSTRGTDVATDDRVVMYMGRAASALAGNYVNTSGTTHVLNYISQQDNANLKKQIIKHESGVDVEAVLDGVSQETLAITGTYTNEFFKIGAQQGASGAFIGAVTFIAVCDDVITPTQGTNIDTIVDNYLAS